MTKTRLWLTTLIGFALMVAAPMGLNMAFAQTPVPGPSVQGAPPAHGPSGTETSGPVAGPSPRAPVPTKQNTSSTTTQSEGDVSTQAVELSNLDFAAANPDTYNHAATGRDGGEYDGGDNAHAVEELNAEDFTCGDHVRFYLAVEVEEGGNGSQNFTFAFNKETTGQPGLGYTAPFTAGKNTGDSFNTASAGDTNVFIVGVTSGTAGGHDAWLVTVRATNLDAGEKVVIYVTATLACPDPENATGELLASLESPQGQGNQTVPMKNPGAVQAPVPVPGVDIDKSCPASATVGESITYTITIRNTGEDDLSDVAVADSVLGDLSGSFADTLATGASETETFSHTVAASPDPLTNTATVSATGVESEQTVSSSASCTTDVVPGLAVTGFKDGGMAAWGQALVLFGVAMVLFWHGEPGRHRRRLLARQKVND